MESESGPPVTLQADAGEHVVMTSVLSDMIIDATENLYQTGILGLVLLDKDFNIVDSHGILVDWIDVGSPAVEVFPFLIGYDDEFEEIKSRKRESLLLPWSG